MPISKKTVSTTDLHEQLRQDVFLCDDTNESKQVGLEVELIPLLLDLPNEEASIVPFAQPADSGEDSVLSTLDRLAERVDGFSLEHTSEGIPVYKKADGGLITFEPGGQIEYSSAPRKTAAAAFEDVEEFIRQLEAVPRSSKLFFLTTGINPWHTVKDIGLQVNKPRYTAMDEYFATIGPYGRRMMRQTCSIQLNVDMGDSEHTALRWKAANLLAPVLTALFANSPVVDRKATGFRNFRSHVWQNTDTSRTGYPPGLLNTTLQADPAEQYLQFALDARVMIIRESESHFTPVTQVLSFRQWLENGHPLGYPTMDDWDYHLSTLFPEVRPRGFLEVRCIDGQPEPWRSVPVTFMTVLLYDDWALEKTVDILSPWQPRLPELSARAAQQATHDEILGPLAKQMFHLVLDSLPRFPEACLTESMRADATAFYDHYARRLRCPADDFNDVIAKEAGQRFLPSHYSRVSRMQTEFSRTGQRSARISPHVR